MGMPADSVKAARHREKKLNKDKKNKKDPNGV